MLDFRLRLETFLSGKNQPLNIEQLTPDASTREYFRVEWNGEMAIACVYPEPFSAKEHAYLDVTNLFLRGNLPVAAIYDFDESLAVIVQEDFGDTILRDVLLKSDEALRETLLNDAISLIARIQGATTKAFELDSIASRLKFDEEKLLWELNFFKTHYFETFRKAKLSESDERALIAEFIELSEELETRAAVLCHRDFHAANLMIDRENRLRIIDHQDARIGSTTYDLVSLLLDRVLQMPDKHWLETKKRFFLSEREKLNIASIDFAEFETEFRLQTIQRCLKAVGTFSFQSVNRGKTYFIPFMEPLLQIVLEACRQVGRFPNLQRIIGTDSNS
jgi:aminoglycoside/choline kinase family phosphotransferase